MSSLVYCNPLQKNKGFSGFFSSISGVRSYHDLFNYDNYTVIKRLEVWAKDLPLCSRGMTAYFLSLMDDKHRYVIRIEGSSITYFLFDKKDLVLDGIKGNSFTESIVEKVTARYDPMDQVVVSLSHCSKELEGLWFQDKSLLSSKSLYGSYKRGVLKRKIGFAKKQLEGKEYSIKPVKPLMSRLDDAFKRITIRIQRRKEKKVRRDLARLKFSRLGLWGSSNNGSVGGKRGFSTFSTTFQGNAVRIRRFSASSRAYESDNRIDLFNRLSVYFENKNFQVNKKNQLELEEFLLDLDVSLGNKSDSYLHDVKTKFLGGAVTSIIKNKEKLIKQYINKLLKTTVEKDKLKTEVLGVVGKDFIYSISIYYLLLLLTHIGNDRTDFVSITYLTINVGKQTMDKYFRTVKDKDESSYKIWLKSYLDNNKYLKRELEKDDTFYASLGGKILSTLVYSDIIANRVVRVGRSESREEFYISDPDLSKLDKKDIIMATPLKLPMIVEPKLYKGDSSGGYLLNDVKYYEDIFTDKNQYKIPSVISSKNYILPFINKVSRIPFKINKELLEFVTSNVDLDLIINNKELESFGDISLLSKYKQTKYKSLLSKWTHQEYILKIADLFKNFNSIYFPVKLDHRGRLYCTPAYFNYQSSDLAKSLILFSMPGIINKNNLESVKYLKAYGVNCFGNDISKGSNKAKTNWVEENLDNIINFENGILIKQAKEKLLFAAFCIEYKKFNEFMNNDSISEFHTHLPIQLDATCNGFQHLSLLSQESKIFEELNLTSSKKVDADNRLPKDFYTFLLHKLNTFICGELDKGIDLVGKGSYSRLNSFIWNRTHVKKIIMTIPYNSTERSMKEYLTNELHRVEYSVSDKCYWYSAYENSPIKVNGFDISLLITTLRSIISRDFSKIDNLIVYLRNVAKLFNKLELPIYWCLPSGLKIYQSYLYSKSITISPFSYSKIRINLKVSDKNKLDNNKQIRSLMPNLIHSLDAYSMTRLFTYFSQEHKVCQFYSVHDCFGTTTDKVESLKNMLVYVYVELYSDNAYLEKFDANIIKYIKDNTNYTWNGRTINFPENKYELFDIKWVLNDKLLSKKDIERIDSQNILI